MGDADSFWFSRGKFSDSLCTATRSALWSKIVFTMAYAVLSLRFSFETRMFHTVEILLSASMSLYIALGLETCTYNWPNFLFILSTVSPWSIILIFTPGVLARSVTAAVGRPPTQKNASILRSLMAFTD